MKWEQQIDVINDLWEVSLVSFDGFKDPDEYSSEKWVSGLVWVCIIDNEGDGEDNLGPENLVWNVGVTGVNSEGLQEESNVENGCCGQPSGINAKSSSEEEVLPPVAEMVVGANVENYKSRSQHNEGVN